MSWFSNPHTRPYIDLGWTIALYLDQVLGCINHFGQISVSCASQCWVIFTWFQIRKCWSQSWLSLCAIRLCSSLLFRLVQINNECCQFCSLLRQLRCWLMLAPKGSYWSKCLCSIRLSKIFHYFWSTILCAIRCLVRFSLCTSIMLSKDCYLLII